MVHFCHWSGTQRFIDLHRGCSFCSTLEEDDYEDSPPHSTFEEAVHDAEHAFEEIVDDTKSVLNNIMADVGLLYCYTFTLRFADLRYLVYFNFLCRINGGYL